MILVLHKLLNTNIVLFGYFSFNCRGDLEEVGSGIVALYVRGRLWAENHGYVVGANLRIYLGAGAPLPLACLVTESRRGTR